MTHETIQESTLKNEGAPVPYVSHESHYERSIGPVDATDFERGLLLRSAENLAEIAAVNFGEYESHRAALVASATRAILNGTLRLGNENAELPTDARAEKFVVTAINDAYRPRVEVDEALIQERISQRLGAKGVEQVLQTKILEQQATIRRQAERMLDVRTTLVEGEASEEYLRKFDYMTKIMTKPEQEQYELEKSLVPDDEPVPLVDTEESRLHQVFKGIIKTSYWPIDVLKGLRLAAPHSAPITIVEHQENK